MPVLTKNQQYESVCVRVFSLSSMRSVVVTTRNATGLNRRVLQLTDDELGLFEFASALGDWLEPHHDHIRPPPAAVMSEVARLAEQKAGQQPRGLQTVIPLNGDDSTNGHARKDQEPPLIKEPSFQITKFFDGTLLFSV